ncbi:hypothetical protein [Nocardia wallacei]|uniref:hypothetical protein n=1 Tax=Nocardia wallacei TaxID=480035 RepID=UPI0024540F23|nr:hypothetical protein [Nocardia wallacei]
MEAPKHLGLKAIGELLGVSPATVSKWRTRYADTDHPCPEPTLWIDDTPGWSDPSAWQAWKLSLPGRGKGGGPLPIARARQEYLDALTAVRQEFPTSRPSRQEIRALDRIAATYGVDSQGLKRLAMDIGDANRELPIEECDIMAIATVIRSTRKAA